MAKDIFHQQVKKALIKDGWNITHDPLTIRISEAVKLQVETYQDFFQLSFIQRMLQRYQIKLIIYDPKREEIKQWIS